jgi:hypothetical protein
MSRKAPKPPEEPAEVGRMRDRQMTDLARLDEEENERIKRMRAISRGVRAFRGLRSTSGRGTTSSGTAASTPSTVPRGGPAYGLGSNVRF